MSVDEGAQSFGPGLSALVSEAENQMAEERPQLGGSGGELELPDLMLETSYCCQSAARVSSANFASLGDLLDVVLSHEFGKGVFGIPFCHRWYVWGVQSWNCILLRQFHNVRECLS